MELAELLAFAVKHRATELSLAAERPPFVKFRGLAEARPINVDPLTARDLDEMLAPMLSLEAKEALRFNGKFEMPYEISGLGKFVVRISKEETVFIVLPPPAEPPAGNDKPGVFRRLFGG